MSLRDEGFQTINPPLPLFRPAAAHETVRGYLLSQQQQEQGAPSFFVLQLTHAYEGVAAGELMAVEEVRSIRGLAHMLPNFVANPAGTIAAEFAYEIVVEPYERNGVGWQHLIHARRVTGAGATPAIGTPPSFPMMAKEAAPSAVLPPAPRPPAPAAPQPVAAASSAAEQSSAADALAAGAAVTTQSRDAQGVVTRVTIEPAAAAEQSEPAPAEPASSEPTELDSLLQRAAEIEEAGSQPEEPEQEPNG